MTETKSNWLFHAITGLVALMLGVACAQKPVSMPSQDDRTRPAFGIKLSSKVIQFHKPLVNGATSGLLLETVFPYFPASKAGLRTGDILVGFQNEIFKNLSANSSEVLSQRLAALPLGSVVHLEVLRYSKFALYQVNQDKEVLLKEGELPPIQNFYQSETASAQNELHAHWKTSSEILTFEVPVQGRRWDYGDQSAGLPETWPELGEETEIRPRIQKWSEDPQLQADYLDLKQRLASLAALTDSKRLPVVRYLQKNPERMRDFQNLMLQKARNCQHQELLAGCFADLARGVGSSFALPKSSPFPEIRSLQDYIARVQQVLHQSDEILAQAFRNLSPADFDFLKTNATSLTEALMQGLYVHEDEDPYRKTRNLRLLDLLQKVRLEPIGSSLLPLQSLFSPEVIRRLQELSRSVSAAPNAIVEKVQTPEGLILIGGRGPNDYSAYANQNVIFILDLGGDDFYPDISANILDLSGQDRYQATRAWTLNAGFFRTRMLVDIAGDDIYQCTDGCLAGSLLGASLLVDLDGGDIYRARSFAMGASIAGVSVLWDGKGDDFYQSTVFSQAVGIAGGLGILMDEQGQDRYFSQGGPPSSYADPGQFDGWSQGVGIGLRNFVSGGWGFLYDGGGRDQFESGTFSMGGGYYFGLGMLINDGKEDDRYLGARYTQGFSAHYAIGDFLEVGGNDVYQSSSFVGEGMAWDLSLSLFEDRAGQDIYKTCEHCLGVASQNSLAIFYDAQGADRYEGSDLPYRGPRYNDYHGGQSFGFFFDLGNAQDDYQSLKNHSQRIEKGYHLLLDE
jgi:hypothetical protein